MAVPEQLKALKPLQGELVTLPSVQELRPVDSFEEAYVAEIDIKSSNIVTKLLDVHYPRNPELSLSHLRRLLRPENLPEPLKQDLETLNSQSNIPPPTASIHVLIPPPLPEVSEIQTLLAPYAPKIPSSPVAETQATEETEPAEPEAKAEEEPSPTIRVQKTTISLKPPSTAEEALEWSRTKWSTLYNPAARSATHAPPQVQLLRAQASISPRAGYFLSLAEQVADETFQSGRGRAVGAVVVDPESTCGRPDDTDELLNSVVAVAGDTRWCELSSDERKEKGGKLTVDDEAGPQSHAVMRVVSMVSRKRIALNNEPMITSSDPEAGLAPMSPSTLESHFFDLPNLLKSSGGGYLCTALDLYITHEPCLCCSMGMLLSRFRSVTVLNSGMRRLGEGNALDAVHGYGLHWREELNWRAIGFEFIESVDRHGKAEEEFNA